MEHFDLAFEAFKFYTGWQHGPDNRYWEDSKNKNPMGSSPPPPRLAALIREMNSYDLRLYELGCTLFRQQLDAAGLKARIPARLYCDRAIG